MLAYVLKNLINLPKSIWFCMRVFDFKDAVRLPVLMSHNTKVRGAYKGAVRIEGPVKPGMIKYGIEGIEGVSAARRSYIRFGRSDKPRIIFTGEAYFGSGCMISVDNGQIKVGKSFSSNNNLYISCNERIEFGDDVTLGWDINFMDSDNHTVISDGKPKVGVKEIKIGNNVWIASHTDILKGAEIGDGSVLAYRSCLNKQFPKGNQLIGGYPAKVIAENTTWEI